MGAEKPQTEVVVEQNAAIVGIMPAVKWVDDEDKNRWQCRWVRTTTDKQQGAESNALAYGYTSVNPKEVDMPHCVSADKKTIRWAEYVLMKCSKDEWTARQQETERESVARTLVPDKELLDEARRLGVRPYIAP